MRQRRQETIQSYADGLLARKAYKDALKKIDEDEAGGEDTLAGVYSGVSKKAKKDQQEKKTTSAKKKAENRDAGLDADGKSLVAQAELQVILAKKGTDAELRAKKALLQAKFKADTEYLDKSSEEYKKSQAQLNKDMKEADKAYFQEKLAQTEQILQGLANVFSSYVSLLNEKDNAKLAHEKSNNDKSKNDLQLKLSKKLISQKQYDLQVKQMDEAMDARQKEINEQQAKRTKSAALFSAIINGALGITKIWAQYGDIPYYAAILTAIEAAAVGVQIASISQAAVPRGRKGLVVQGSSHEQGGIDMVDRGSGRTVANVEGGEPVLVLSRNTYGNNRSLIDELLYNSQHRNGARVAAGAWYNDAPRPVNAGRIIPLMRSGGVVNNTGAAAAAAGSSAQAQMTGDIANMMQQLVAEQQATREILAAQQQKPVQAFIVYQDIISSADLVAKARSVAGVKQAA